MADLVKSAARAFEIVEVFARERRRMTASELGEKLAYPKSSLNVLLKSLTAQGYLSLQPGSLTYFPTLQLTQLGDWIPSALFGSDALVNTLEALRDRTRETVTLTMAVGFEMRVLRVLLGNHPIALQLAEGYVLPMFGTAIGAAYMSGLSEPQLAALFRRAKEQMKGRQKVDWSTLQQRIAEARTAGFTAAYNAVLEDTGAVAAPVVSPDFGETLVVAVAGLEQRIRRNEAAIVREIKRLTRSIGANASDTPASSTSAA
jgi:DNA-binding IclR family transcriptional regulator